MFVMFCCIILIIVFMFLFVGVLFGVQVVDVLQCMDMGIVLFSQFVNVILMFKLCDEVGLE